MVDESVEQTRKEIHKKLGEIFKGSNDYSETFSDQIAEMDDEWVLYIHGYGVACRLMGARMEDTAAAVLKQRGLHDKIEENENRAIEEMGKPGVNIYS